MSGIDAAARYVRGVPSGARLRGELGTLCSREGVSANETERRGGEASTLCSQEAGGRSVVWEQAGGRMGEAGWGRETALGERDGEKSGGERSGAGEYM